MGLAIPNRRHMLNFYFSLEHEIGWAGEGDILVLVAVALKVDQQNVAASDPDVDRGLGVGELVVDDGVGDHTSATGQSLVFDAALVSADRDAAS